MAAIITINIIIATNIAIVVRYIIIIDSWSMIMHEIYTMHCKGTWFRKGCDFSVPVYQSHLPEQLSTVEPGEESERFQRLLRSQFSSAASVGYWKTVPVVLNGFLTHDGLNPAHVPYWRVNNPTLSEFCFWMIGRADIEGSKSYVAMNAWQPQASYPCGNFSGTSFFKLRNKEDR